MKPRVLLALALLLAPLSAAASNLTFVRMTTDLWQARSTVSLNNTYAIVVHLPDEENLIHDKDLRPFVKAAMKAGETMFVVIMTEEATPRIAMYFRDDVPTFFTIGTGARERVPEKIPVGKETLIIEPGDLTADDDTPLDAYEITVPGSAEI